MGVALGLSRPLVVRTVAVDDPGDLITALPTPTPYAWIHHGEGLVGWGEAARVQVPAGPDRFGWARQWLAGTFARAHVDDELDLPGTGPVAFGSFTFDASSPGSVLVVPRTVLARRDGRAWLTTISDGLGGRVDGPFEDTPRPRPLDVPGRIRYSDGSLTAPQWEHAVAQAVRAIRADRLSKVVLARDLTALAERQIDIRILLDRLSTRYPECYTFSCDGLVGATPELLIRRTGKAIESLVLAGTTTRGGDATEDVARGAGLFASAKDRSEHAYAVESVREALTPLCDELHVPAEPRLLVLPNLQHLASPVSGRLTDGASVLDVVAAMHPTAAVGGSPTPVALEVIRELEGMDRGGYAGPVGWIDARGDGEWGIALRCGQISGNRARLFAGGGIMAGSNPADELAEAQTKLRVMQYALEG
ncbi:isochorismate synthase [Rhizohabitans arisaemae]|uniref:isochorismate synthase n=1 Tax=Rhizohabitans arisaemae TaxID=2720610 RepID=UPI0024B11C63|nr:isochorismate synthase [Rhizohabitans arisaemae]